MNSYQMTGGIQMTLINRFKKNGPIPGLILVGLKSRFKVAGFLPVVGTLGKYKKSNNLPLNWKYFILTTEQSMNFPTFVQIFSQNFNGAKRTCHYLKFSFGFENEKKKKENGVFLDQGPFGKSTNYGI